MVIITWVCSIGIENLMPGVVWDWGYYITTCTCMVVHESGEVVRFPLVRQVL